jgi:two-component system cell cycle response regulator
MQTLKLLLIDDGRLVQAIFAQSLADPGVELICCESGQAALALLAHQHVDFICASASLPDGGGAALIWQIRTLPGCRYLPVALMTCDEMLPDDALDVTEVFRKQDMSQLVSFFSRLIEQSRPIKAQILYVEDSVSQAQVMMAQLDNHGMTVDWHPDAESALIALTEKSYDLLLTDISLGTGLDGFMFAKRIRRMGDGAGEIPIIALTAHDNTEQRIGLFSIGINDYLVKPVLEEELMVRIRRLVERQQMMLTVKANKQNLKKQVAERLDQYQLVQTQLLNSVKGMQGLLDSMVEGAYGVDVEGRCTFSTGYS